MIINRRPDPIISCEWESQYSDFFILRANSNGQSFNSDLEVLVEVMNSVSTFIYFDSLDFMVPVNHFFENQLPILNEKGTIEYREGYGHWIGNSTFGRILGEL